MEVWRGWAVTGSHRHDQSSLQIFSNTTLDEWDHIVHKDWITWQYDGAITLYPKLLLRHLEKLSEDFTVKIRQGYHKASSVRAVNNKMAFISHWWRAAAVCIHTRIDSSQWDPFPTKGSYLLPLPCHSNELLGTDHAIQFSSSRENTPSKNVEKEMRFSFRKIERYCCAVWKAIQVGYYILLSSKR